MSEADPRIAEATESLIDLVTLTFQALVGVCLIVGLGWAVGRKRYGQVLLDVSQTALLPALVFVTLAGSSTLTWKRLGQQWPAVIIALSTHLPSALFGKACERLGGSEAWLTEAVTYNNVSSFPLILLQLLTLLSTDSSALGHLRWRSLDTVAAVYRRGVEYVLLNLLIVTAARLVLRRFIPRLITEESQPDLDSDDLDEPRVNPTSDERSPLLSHTQGVQGGRSGTTSPLAALRPSPLAIAALAGLLVGLIKPLQRVLVGSHLSGTSIDGAEMALTGLWRSLGLALGLIGGAFAVLDLLAQGAVLRAGAEKRSSEKQPPILGPILLVTVWRYAIVPAISISIVHGFRKVHSTAAYLQDPAFSFVLVLTTLSPPTLPSGGRVISAYRAQIHSYLFLTSLVLSIPLSLALAYSAAPGRSVSFETDFDLGSALKRAAGGGLAGALAMVLQVLLLMPMRTVMNYQYRYGGKVVDGAKKLYGDGGFRRYYAGMGAALFQGPLARFGDTAANAFILSLLASLTWPVLIKTVAASLASAAFRMVLTPIDTLKTTQQTRGGEAGWRLLKERIKKEGVQCLWWGALATAAATFVGHYPWFGTYNFLSEHLPPAHTQLSSLARQAFIGFAASVASDTISNSLRVVKTYRQVHERDVGYFTAAKEIVHLEGITGLFGRGLPVRLLTNGLQGLLFSILWKRFEDGISHSGTAGWAIAISLVGALYLGALVRAVLSLESVQAGIRRLLGRAERARGPIRLPEGEGED